MPAVSAIAVASLAVAATAATMTPAAQPTGGWDIKAQSSLETRAAVTVEDPLQISRPLADDPSMLPGMRTFEQRVRAGGRLLWATKSGEFKQVSLQLQADLFSGPSARWRPPTDSGSTTHSGAALAPPDRILAADPRHHRSLSWGAADTHWLRRFAVKFQTRWASILAGRTVSKWGLGLLAQDGVDDPLQFGFKRRGTVVDRLQATIIPAAIAGDGSWAAVLPVAIAVAADNVIEDDLANVIAGEHATNLIGAIAIRLEHFEGGIYGVSRSQVDSAGLRIDALVGDVHARWHDRIGKHRIEVATEWLAIKGKTTYFRTATNPDALQIDQFGGVVRATLQRSKLTIRLETGLTSADRNLYDDTVRNLKFARDYRVGLVLFSDVLRRVTASTAANLADPRFAGQPPTGYQRLASGGAVNQALYFNPVIGIGPFHGLSAMAGYVMARSPSQLIDPYRSGLAGGQALGPMGGPAKSHIGSELDLALQYRVRFGSMALITRADWGCATLGEAFADKNGDIPPRICTLMGQVIARAKW